MVSYLERLRLQMEEAAAALEFEEAQRLRDEISLLRGAENPGASIDVSGLSRQRPGAMGLGTSDQKMKPPPGWTPPRRPDPMTSGVKGRKRRR
jgi:hypothetical protein